MRNKWVWSVFWPSCKFIRIYSTWHDTFTSLNVFWISNLLTILNVGKHLLAYSFDHDSCVLLYRSWSFLRYLKYSHQPFTQIYDKWNSGQIWVSVSIYTTLQTNVAETCGVRKLNIGLKKPQHNPLLICYHCLFSSMPSFMNSAELKRLETRGAEIVVRASH